MNGKHDNVWDEMLRESEEIEASQVAETGAAENIKHPYNKHSLC